MFAPLHPTWADRTHVVIGMIHLRALPGSPGFDTVGDMRCLAVEDARALRDGGVDGLMIENFGDVPFFPGRVPANTVAYMTAVAAEVRRAVPDLPLGINVLRNDGLSALAVAHAVQASFIRVNVLCGARVTDQGLIQGIAHDLLRERTKLKAHDVKILADVDVKHSAPLAPRPLGDEVDDLIERALADAVIVSGAGTGKATDPQKFQQVKAAVRGRVPVMIGSGITADSLKEFLPHADGFIVGTAFKMDGRPTNPVDVERVNRLMQRLK
jgi:membrane complex biogenesis BtpA family protein